MIRARLGALLLAAVVAGLAFPGVARAQVDAGGRAAIVVLASDASLEDLLGVPALAGVAAFGGAALLSTGAGSVREAVAALPPGSGPGADHLAVSDAGSLLAAGVADRSRIEEVVADLRTRLEASTAGRVVVVVASATPSPRTAAAGDTLGAVVVATGRPGAIAAAMDATGARPGSLTSDSTRRDGVVVPADVAATVASHLGLEAVPDLGGHVISTTGSEPPFALHDRYLQQRRLSVPVGTAAALAILVAGLLGVAALALGDRVPTPVRRVLGWIALSVPALATGMLAAGHLPQLTYATAIPFLAIVTVFGTVWTTPLERRDVTLIPAAIGALVLVAFVLEALSGWGAMLTPLLGGAQLDGGRFFGMPNVAIGLVVGAGVWLAHRLPTGHGVVVLASSALVAGLPFAGANLGAGVTLFATAGIWWAVREVRRLGRWRGVALAAFVTLAGTALIFAAHVVSPLPTHVSSFARTAGGPGGILGTFLHRLGTGFELIGRNPAALIPVVGLLVTLVVVLRPTPALRATFTRWPGFRDATLVIALGGVVAYLANDTGAAASGLAFGLALGGMVGVSLLSPAGKMAER